MGIKVAMHIMLSKPNPVNTPIKCTGSFMPVCFIPYRLSGARHIPGGPEITEQSIQSIF